MATFRFELDHKPTRNKTYNLYLMVTAAGKRTKKKTGIQLKRIDDFNPQCKGNNWIRANEKNCRKSRNSKAALNAHQPSLFRSHSSGG